MIHSAEQSQSAASLQSRVAAAHRTARILVIAFSMSIVVYAGVGLLILKLRTGTVQSELPYPFYAAAAVLAIGSIVIRRAMLHRMKLEGVAATRGLDGLIKHLLNSTIIGAGIAEIIGVLALLVAFFGGDGNDVLRLGFVGLVVAVYNYPRRAAWERVVAFFAAASPAGGESPLGL